MPSKNRATDLFRPNPNPNKLQQLIALKIRTLPYRLHLYFTVIPSRSSDTLFKNLIQQ